MRDVTIDYLNEPFAVSVCMTDLPNRLSSHKVNCNSNIHILLSTYTAYMNDLVVRQLLFPGHSCEYTQAISMCNINIARTSSLCSSYVANACQLS